LEHICEPQVLFKEISRILAKDGYLILSVPFLYHLHEEPFDYYRYTPHGLKHLAKEAGLEIVSLEHYGSAFGVLVDISSKITEVIINGICKFMPKFIAAFIKKLGDKILCLFQQICFFILKQKPVLQALKISKLSPRIALGYIAVFTVNKEI
jgi:SAM-dependent methyltransferase